MPHSRKLLVCAALSLATPVLAAPPTPSPVYEVSTEVSTEASTEESGAVATPATDSLERDPRTNRPKLVGKPSGFWTSPRPARGGAYRYRMLGIGAVLLAITGLVTLRVLRRHGVRVPDAERPWSKPTA